MTLKVEAGTHDAANAIALAANVAEVIFRMGPVLSIDRALPTKAVQIQNGMNSSQPYLVYIACGLPSVPNRPRPSAAIRLAPGSAWQNL